MSIDISVNESFEDDEVLSITKKYSDEKEYLKISSNVRKYRGIIRKFGTSIFATDDSTKSIVIEYIQGKKLRNFLLHNLDPWKSGGFNNLFQIIKQVNVLTRDFHSHGVMYEKIDIDNFVIMNSNIKMTNLETIIPIGYISMQDILSIIYDQIIDILGENITNRQVISNTIFEEQRESVNDLRKLMKNIF